MTVVPFGFATPLNFNDLAEGMLVLAATGQTERYFGVVSKFSESFVLVVVSASDGAVPGALDLGNVSGDLWRIPGALEIEPAGLAFEPGEQSAPIAGYVIDSIGALIASFRRTNHYGEKERALIDLSTGKHTRGTGKIAAVGDVKFFIRQDGRRDRFEWPVLAKGK